MFCNNAKLYFVFVVQVDHLGKTELLNCQQVTVAMLTHLKTIAENGLKTKVHDCVISVSAISLRMYKETYED